MERPRQGFIYASSPSWLTVLNIVMNKATMRQVHQVCLLMSYTDAQGLGMVRRMVCCSKPCLQFWVVTCAYLRFPVKKQYFSFCVTCCKIHAWKPLRIVLWYCLLGIAKFAAHLCCVCFYYFFSGADLRFLIQGIRNTSSAMNLINSADIFVQSHRGDRVT